LANVLVAEDDVEMSRFIVKILEREGYTVSEAHDGEEALRLVGSGGVNVLVLDLMMPKVDGFEVIRRLRMDERTKDLPIVVCSALPRKSLPETERAVLSTVVAHISKPFDVKEFLFKVKEAATGRNGHPKTRTVVV